VQEADLLQRGRVARGMESSCNDVRRSRRSTNQHLVLGKASGTTISTLK